MSLLDRVERFEISSNSWVTVAPLQTARCGLAACTLGERIFAIGGLGSPDGSTQLASMEIYSDKTNTWEFGESMSTPRAWIACAVLNGQIFCVGGWDGVDHVNTVEKYDPVANTWVAVKSMNCVRCAPGCAVVDGRLYVAGGQNEEGEYQNSVEYYNAIDDSWNFVVSLLNRRRVHSAELMTVDIAGW